MSKAGIVVACRENCVTFSESGLSVDVLHDINLSVRLGESVSVVGASGSGKSTLLHTLGGLMEPTSGEVVLSGQTLKGLTAAQSGNVRNRHLGFVYQFHHRLSGRFTHFDCWLLHGGKRWSCEGSLSLIIKSNQ